MCPTRKPQQILASVKLHSPESNMMACESPRGCCPQVPYPHKINVLFELSMYAGYFKLVKR